MLENLRSANLGEVKFSGSFTKVREPLPSNAFRQRAWGGRARAYALAAMVLCGLGCRVYGLAFTPLWSDEAESSINALTILQRGVPADRYLGQPLYENQVIEPWPESAEFEFRDVSYSPNGVAIYHAWLPLYAIAASCRLFGIEPDRPGMTRPVHDAQARERRTIAVRAPSIFFGVLCILGFYLAGVRLHSGRAGLIAAFMATFLALHISYSQTARYYAATTAGITFCVWAILTMRQSARWRDYLLGGIIFSLLFYTHLLGFSLACIMWTFAVLPLLYRNRRALPRVAAFAGIIAVSCAPWFVATDFIRQSDRIPRAWRLMNLPRDLIIGRIIFSEFGLVVGVGLVLLVAAAFCTKWTLANRASAVFRPHRKAILFACVWLVLTYFWFIFNIPAASFWTGRLALLQLPVTLLLTAMMFCSAAEVFSKSRPGMVAAIGTVGLVVASNLLHPHGVPLIISLSAEAQHDSRDAWHTLDMSVEYLSNAKIDRSTKLFAAPNIQHMLTFYTGMAVQSIVPIRRTFLNSYPGDIIVVMSESFWRRGPLRADLLQREAQTAGQPLSNSEASGLTCRLSSLEYRSRAAAHVAHVNPPLESVPEFASELWKEHQLQSPAKLRRDFAWFPRQFILASNIQIREASDWWFAFFYQLVNPGERRRHPNYEERLRNATLTVPSCADWVFYYSPGSASR